MVIVGTRFGCIGFCCSCQFLPQNGNERFDPVFQGLFWIISSHLTINEKSALWKKACQFPAVIQNLPQFTQF